MDKTQLQALLAEMPLTDEVKQDIMGRQAAGDSPKVIFDLIQAKLQEAKQEILKDDPELAAEYGKLEDQHMQEVTAAAEEFDKEMASINSDLKTFDQDVAKDMDQARMEQLKWEQQEIGK